MPVFGLIGIARAIAAQRQVLFLDERCASIDPIWPAKIAPTIDDLKGDHGARSPLCATAAEK
jgi:ABC-type phosphate transport system ATPase subunit